MAVSGAVRGCFWPRGGCSRTSQRSSSNSWCGWPSPRRGCGCWRSGAGYGCAAVLLGNTVSESVSCGIMLAFAARTPEFAPRPDAPLHPYTHKELYDILWPVEGSRLLASALQAAEAA